MGNQWFAAISHKHKYHEEIFKGNVERQKQVLCECFGSWHDPIPKLLSACEESSLYSENAVSFTKYCNGNNNHNTL